MSFEHNSGRELIAKAGSWRNLIEPEPELGCRLELKALAISSQPHASSQLWCYAFFTSLTSATSLTDR